MSFLAEDDKYSITFGWLVIGVFNVGAAALSCLPTVGAGFPYLEMWMVYPFFHVVIVLLHAGNIVLLIFR